MQNSLGVGRDLSIKDTKLSLKDVDYSQAKSGSPLLWRRRLIVSTIITLPIVIISLLRLFPDSVPFNTEVAKWSAPVSAISATISMLFFAIPFLRNSVKGLTRSIFNTESLISIGTFTAYSFSIATYGIYYYQNHSPFITDYQPDLYFSVVVFLYFFFILGKWIETRAIDRALSHIIKITRPSNNRVHLTRQRQVVDIPINRIKPDDKILVLSGETIPTDGIVLWGNSLINESMITGESMPVKKNIGSPVIGGTINGYGKLLIKVTKTGDEAVLSKIINLVSYAKSARSHVENMANRIANIVGPSIVGVSMATFISLYFIAHTNLNTAGISSVLIIIFATPPALSLAVPIATAISIEVAIKNNILFKNNRHLGRLSKINAVVFDKTGTLTTGQPIISNIKPIRASQEKALSLARALTSNSMMPFAKAIALKFNESEVEKLRLDNRDRPTENGYSGKLNNHQYYIGNKQMLLSYLKNTRELQKYIDKQNDQNYYLFTVQEILAIFTTSDQIREDAPATIEHIHSLGIKTVLLSGDSKSIALKTAHKLGIKNVVAEVMPDKKAEVVLKLRKSGYRVAMVGDGINDTPALASSNVGIAIGSGASAAVRTGDVILLNDSLMGVYRAIKQSCLSNKKSWQNIFLSIILNIVTIPLAAGLITVSYININSELVNLIALVSVSSVIMNSMLIRITSIRFNRKQ